MPNVKKAKWILVDDPIKAIKLYFKSLCFQDMAKFYGINNIRGLKQYHAFKKVFLVEAFEKIQKTRKNFIEQVEIGEHLIKKW